MRFVNPNGNAKQLSKYKTIRGVLTSIPIIIALVGGIIIGRFIASGDIVTKVGMYAMSIGMCELFGGFLAILIHVYAFNKKIAVSELSVTHDLRYNIAVCDHCGRIFDFSELSWSVNKTGSVTRESDRRGLVTTYKGNITVRSNCPTCNNDSCGAIEVDLEQDVTKTEHIIFTDRDKTTSYSTKKSGKEIEAIVKSRYEDDLRTAQQILRECSRNGYIIDTH